MQPLGNNKLGVKNMYGIPCEGGKNDCYWNFYGKCTSWVVTQTKPHSKHSRNWNSNQNCTLTQLGTPICGEYLQKGKVT